MKFFREAEIQTSLVEEEEKHAEPLEDVKIMARTEMLRRASELHLNERNVRNVQN